MDITQRKIVKIARSVSKFTARTLRSDGIGTAEMDVLHVIRKNPGITQAEVLKTLGIDKGAAARNTANLEAKGYIFREVNPADGRSQLLYATPKADRLKNSKAHVEAAFFSWLLEPLTEPEKKEFTRLLDILYQRSKAEDKAGFPEMNRKIQEEENHEK